jgi:hypothetical protein
MMRRMTSPLLLSSAAVLALTLAVAGQSPARVVLRSGEERPAQNIGFFDGNELIVRTSLAEEPRFPISQVAYIDFGGGSDVPVRFRGGQHAIVLRDGGIVPGQVLRIAHTNQENPNSPFLISFRTSNGQERQFQGSEVARVYFAEPGPTAAARQDRRRGAIGTIGSDDDSREVDVAARQRWTSTGMMVRRGERLGFRSTGQIRLSTSGLTASPDGSGQNDPGSPLPQVFSGALIGRIGNGRPFAIGSQTEIEMPDSGPFVLGINDSELSDNDGSFRVEVRRLP